MTSGKLCFGRFEMFHSDGRVRTSHFTFNLTTVKTKKFRQKFSTIVTIVTILIII